MWCETRMSNLTGEGASRLPCDIAVGKEEDLERVILLFSTPRGFSSANIVDLGVVMVRQTT